MRLPLKDYILVGIQGLLFLAFIFDVSLTAHQLPLYTTTIGLIVSVIGIAIFILSILQLSTSLSPFPTPKADGKLIQTGLYKYIRHPIYTGILVCCIGYTVYSSSLYRLIIVALLFLLFSIKVRYEEEKLTLKFPRYKNYMKTSGRFFPRLF